MEELNKILKIIDDAPARFESRIPDIEKKIFRDVSLLLKDLKTNANGKIQSSIENLRLINEIKTKLGKIVVSKQYASLVRDFVSNIPAINNFQTGMKGIPADSRKMMTAVAKTRIDNTLESLVGSGYKQAVVSKLYDTLLTSVTSGGSYAEMIERLQKQLVTTEETPGLLSKYTKTFVVDSLGEFAGQGNKMIADALKSEWFRYTGSNLTTTREFCRHLTKKHYVHKSEIPDLLKGKIDGHQCKMNEKTGLPLGMKEDTNADNFIVHRGGWNCGHELIPVSDLSVPKEVRDKIAATLKPVKPVKSEEQKAGIQKRWEERLRLNAKIKEFDELLPDARKSVSEFGEEKIQTVFNAVKSKLAEWKNESLEYQLKKLHYEGFEYDGSKYDTWEVAKAAYQKQYAKVENQIAKENVKLEIAHAAGFAKTTKSKVVKDLVDKFNELFASENTSIDTLKGIAKELNQRVEKLEANAAKKNALTLKNIDESNYTQKRKDDAFWEKESKAKSDSAFRKDTEKIWENATDLEKISMTKYTGGSGSYNRPLRGFEDSWYDYKGVGQVDLNREGSADNIKSLTGLIDRSVSKKDVWLQRGIETKQGTSNFLGLGINASKLNAMSKTELQSMVGKIVRDDAFVSCGSMKGVGFNGDILNIYCPRGTKMIYSEPFSVYNGDALTTNNLWDGKTKYEFGGEMETIIQRGSYFRITKIERNPHGKLYIDCEVVGQI